MYFGIDKVNNEFGGEDMIDALLRTKENSELQFPDENDRIKAVILVSFDPTLYMYTLTM